MKTFNTLLFITFLSISAHFYGQGVTTIAASSPNTCDGSAYFNDSSTYSSWFWTDANFTLIEGNVSAIYNLCPGTGYVIATDGNGTDTISYTIQVNECSGFGASLYPTNPTLGTCNGTIDSQVFGGTAPYFYQWSNGATTVGIDNLCMGVYTLTVVDSQGCSNTQTIQLGDSIGCNNLNINLDTITLLSTPMSCDGSMTVSFSGGDGNYSYTWSNGVNATTLTNLCAGTYQITVVDGNGCSATQYYSMYSDSTADCSGFGAYLLSSTNASSGFICDGAATIEVTGGSGSYSIIWDNTQGTTTNNALCTGYHSVTVYDQVTGCSAYVTIYIFTDSTSQWPLSGYVYPTPPTEDGLCDGTAYVDAWGGSSPYTFLHSNGSTDQFATSLCEGIYSVVVTDANNDTLVLNYIVPQPSNIFNGGIYTDSIVVDSVYSDLLTDCIISYTTLDTAYISSLEYLGNGSLLVTWSILDSNGVVNVTQVYVLTNGVGVYDLILQVFCPQRSGSQYVYAVDQVYFNPATASTESLEGQASCEVFPNPFTNELTIDLGESQNAVVSILDLSGKLIHTEFVSNGTVSIDTSEMSAGSYILRIVASEGMISKKLVK